MSRKYVVHAEDGGKASAPQNGIEEILQTLTRQEEQVIRMRFAIGESGTPLLKEVGERLSVTEERVCQIQVRALRKLRSAIHFVKPITHL